MLSFDNESGMSRFQIFQVLLISVAFIPVILLIPDTCVTSVVSITFQARSSLVQSKMALKKEVSGSSGELKDVSLLGSFHCMSGAPFIFSRVQIAKCKKKDY